jgi:hypothetical protein
MSIKNYWSASAPIARQRKNLRQEELLRKIPVANYEQQVCSREISPKPLSILSTMNTRFHANHRVKTRTAPKMRADYADIQLFFGGGK